MKSSAKPTPPPAADALTAADSTARTGFVRVRGAREHNLKDVSVDIPRDALVVFTGVSGSGKSSLAFGTLYAEAQRRYLESVSPYARRLFHQLSVPDVDSIEGLPPAVALQQQRGAPTTRSSVGSVTTLANLVRMLYSRAGDYPPGQPIIYADAFSANTPDGACPTCHGLGRIYEATEASMVPDPSLTIRERAVAAWPQAWGGQNQRDILVTLGYDVDVPWRDLPQATRDWILFTDEQPVVPVYPGYSPAETQRALKRQEPPNYMGTFTGVRRYVLHTFATTQSALMKRRAAQYLLATDCPTCHGKRLRREALSVQFAGLDIAEFSRLPVQRLAEVLRGFAVDLGGDATESAPVQAAGQAPDAAHRIARQRLAADIVARLGVLLDLGLGYLSLERATPTLSPGELQRLRLATQLHAHLFGVVYVLDEPSAGLHPADTEALLRALAGLKAAGNSLFVVEHDLSVMRAADWLVDVGPGAGTGGGQILYSGPPDGLRAVAPSATRAYLFPDQDSALSGANPRARRAPTGWLRLEGVMRHNLADLTAEFPLGVLTAVTGVSGSGKSSLVSQALVELVAAQLGQDPPGATGEAAADAEPDFDPLNDSPPTGPTTGRIVGGMRGVQRLVRVDQAPIGRTPRSNMATYTGLFDHVRRLFAATPAARKRRYDAGRFSFNVAKGRCETCLGEGAVMVELLFLPSVYAPCPTCHGARYNVATLEIRYRAHSIADVLAFTVDAAWAFFGEETSDSGATSGSAEKAIHRALTTLRDVGLGYLRLGQPATELSGGEAQRIKFATELQRAGRAHALYILDEPTTGLHPADVARLLTQLHGLVDAGHSVIVVEHELAVIAAADWVIDVGPGAGEAGGQIVVAGPPEEVARHPHSRTAPYLRAALAG